MPKITETQQQQWQQQRQQEQQQCMQQSHKKPTLHLCGQALAIAPTLPLACG